MNNLKFALRQLRRNPGFTTIAVLSLAIGIGANIAIFSLINTTILRSLPYPDPDQLVHIAETNAPGNETPVSYPNFLDWQEQQDAFSRLAFVHGADGTLATEGGTEIVAVQHVSAEFFDVLGVRPELGRSLTAGDDRIGAPRVVWVMHDAWERLFDADPKLVGRSISVDNQHLTVAGVLPPDFRFYRRTDLITAVAPFARQFFLDLREDHNNSGVVARLKPGTNMATARANMETIAARLAEEYPRADKGIGVNLVLLRTWVAGSSRTELFLLFGAVGLVLLIACVNVANMLLARSFAREREIAIRASVGASRPQLFRQLLVESLVLATAGGAPGTFLGFWGAQLASRLIPGQVQRVVEVGPVFDLRTALFIVAVTFVTGICFGLLPAWQLSHSQPTDALKRRAGLGRTVFGRIRMSDLLVVAQVALALVLLVGAGLLIRSLQHLLEVKPGYDASRVLTMEVGAPPAEQFQRDPQSFARHYERVVTTVEDLPEVEAAGVVSGLPFAGNYNFMPFYREDQPIPAAGEYPNASSHTVSPDYFRAMGIPLLRGHLFDGTEPAYILPQGLTLTPENLAAIFKGFTISGVISRKMAERFWPGEDPVGKRFHMGPPGLVLPTVQIVGVVGNTVQFGLDQGESTEFYLPLNQWPVPIALHMVVRTRLEPMAAVASVRTAITSALPHTTIRDVRVLSQRIDASTADRRFKGGLFTSFAASAFVLAMIGIYGVLAFNVGRRTREIGIRMALGGRRSDVVRSVLSRGLFLVVPGLVIGLGCAYAGARLLENQLFEVSSRDPMTYAAGAALLLATAVAAACIPARRAARVDPMRALREE
ncbi:MAG: ABC transporter permease [Acidobacteriota bacterium]